MFPALCFNSDDDETWTGPARVVRRSSVRLLVLLSFHSTFNLLLCVCVYSRHAGAITQRATEYPV